MSEIIWLDENETEPRKQNFAIRQLLERVPGIEDDTDTLVTSVGDLETRVGVLEGAAPTTPACFFAHKNGTDQTSVADATITAMTFGTELYDIGSHFASNTWTPPAGKVFLTASCYILSGSAIGLVYVSIYKNGAELATNVVFPGGGAGAGHPVTVVEDVANGSDAYTVVGYADVSSGTATFYGVQAFTHFMGHWISA